MPITPEELLQIAEEKGIDTSKYKAKLQAKSVQPQAGGLTDTMGQLGLNALMPQKRSVLQGLGDVLAAGATGKPDAQAGGNAVEDSLAKLYAQETIKKQFADPNYVVSYDKDGQPVFTKAPGDIKNAPFYSTPMGGQYYQAQPGKADAQGQQAKTETDLMQTVLPQVKAAVSGQSGQGVPPGTTIQAGPINYPVNPALTDVAATTISSANKFEPLVKEVQDIISTGVLSSGKFRPYSQWLAEGGGSDFRRLLTEDNSPMEKLASARQELVKLAFGEGGKTLSPTELPIVKAGLDFTGKSDQQIMTDFNRAMDVLRGKKELFLGGRNAAMGVQQQVQTPTGPQKIGRFTIEEA